MQHDLFAVPCHDTGPDMPPPDASLDQFFTPAWAADLFADDLLAGASRHSVLEPSCGSGSLLGAIPTKHHAIGVEIDPRMAKHARRTTGREVIEGDYRTVSLDRKFTAILANPPFPAELVDALVARSIGWLEDDGVMGIILPAHIPASATRIERWNMHYKVETKLLPRSLFPRLTLPLTWNRLTRSDARTLVGLFLFREAAQVADMPKETRRAFAGGGTWRDVIRGAIAALGGEAELRDIYCAVEPRRRSPNPHWRDKVRQVLQETAHFTKTGDHRWRLVAT